MTTRKTAGGGCCKLLYCCSLLHLCCVCCTDCSTCTTEEAQQHSNSNNSSNCSHGGKGAMGTRVQEKTWKGFIYSVYSSTRTSTRYIFYVRGTTNNAAAEAATINRGDACVVCIWYFLGPLLCTDCYGLYEYSVGLYFVLCTAVLAHSVTTNEYRLRSTCIIVDSALWNYKYQAAV